MEDRLFNKKMVQMIPETMESYEKEIKEWDDDEPGSTIIVEDCLMPIIYKSLENKETMQETINRFIFWLEEVIKNGDKEELNVVYISIFEKMFFDGKIEEISNLFLQNTKNYYAQMEPILVSQEKG